MNIFQKNEQRDVGWQYISLTAGNDEDGIFYCEADNAIGSACLFPPAGMTKPRMRPRCC